MPTNDRHHAALSAATDTYRAAAIGASALPRLSTRALDAERARIARELDRVIGERSVLQSAIDGTQLDCAAAQAESGRAEADAELLRDRQLHLAVLADASSARLAVVEDRQAAVTARLAESEKLVDVVEQLQVGVGTALTKIAGGSLTPEQIHATAGDLDRLVASSTEAELHDAVTALSDWSLALRHGTAPLLPSADSMLGSLADLERRWDDHGRGDLMADPAVAAVRSLLDEARTAQAEIEDQASAGALGERTMSTIRAANTLRTELEDRGNKVDANELRSAIQSETDALHLVGFDSMLDLHIAMSTGGTGTLVENRRTTAADQVAALESELAVLLATTVALHAELQVSFDSLRARADDLVGGSSERPLDQALRGMLTVPEPVREAQAGLDQMLHMAAANVDAQRRELAELVSEASALDLRGAVARAEALRSEADLGRAQQVCDAASAVLADQQQSLEDLRRKLTDADAQVTTTAGTSEVLATRRSLEDDRRELSDAMIATLVEHAIWLSSGAGSLHGPVATAMVIDDPLDDLDDTDAVLLIDELVAVVWPLPVVYVTSRPPIVQRLRQDAGHLVCIDGRRKPRISHRWSTRNDQDESLRS